MSENVEQLIAEAKRACVAVHCAADKEPAEAIDDLLRRMIAAIEQRDVLVYKNDASLIEVVMDTILGMDGNDEDRRSAAIDIITHVGSIIQQEAYEKGRRDGRAEATEAAELAEDEIRRQALQRALEAAENAYESKYDDAMADGVKLGKANCQLAIQQLLHEL